METWINCAEEKSSSSVIKYWGRLGSISPNDMVLFYLMMLEFYPHLALDPGRECLAHMAHGLSTWESCLQVDTDPSWRENYGHPCWPCEGSFNHWLNQGGAMSPPVAWSPSSGAAIDGKPNGAVQMYLCSECLIHSWPFCVLGISRNGAVNLDSNATPAGLLLYRTNCVVNVKLQRLFWTQRRREVETKSSSDQLPVRRSRRRCQVRAKVSWPACVCMALSTVLPHHVWGLWASRAHL